MLELEVSALKEFVVSGRVTGQQVIIMLPLWSVAQEPQIGAE